MTHLTMNTMLIIPIYINENKIDELYILNLTYDVKEDNCVYSVKSRVYGEMGSVRHHRPDGVYKLIEIVGKYMDEHAKLHI